MSSQVLDVLAPALPESVEDGSLLKWHLAVGQSVERDQLLAEVETDKVVLEIVALQSGTLTEILVPEGGTVVAGQILAKLQPGEVSTAEAPKAEPAAAPEPTAAQQASPRSVRGGEHGVGPAERRRRRNQEPAPESAPSEAQQSGVPAEIPADVQTPAPAASADDGEAVTRTPMTRLRATIAKRMLQVRQQTAMLTTFNEVDMSKVMEIRRQHKDAFEAGHGVRLGFMSFFVRAAVQALHQFPLVNAAIDGDDILTYRHMHIGIAVSSDRGLVVPVLRHAEGMTLQQIEAAIAEYGEKARRARLVPEDLQGGTFTISNGGIFGSLLSTPILNPPQSAILGMHRIQERPVAENGQVVIRPMMNLALSYDHRLIDGREAVGFLVSIKQNIEDPVRMLLEI